MNVLAMAEAVEEFNWLINLKIPFLFIISYDRTQNYIEPLQSVDPESILFSINGVSNSTFNGRHKDELHFEKYPIDYDQFYHAFEKAQSEIQSGNTYLINLTFSTPITTNYNLEQFFHFSEAKYKLWIRDRLTVFSPETFFKMRNGEIFSFPMKGTIDAKIPGAETMIMADKKELSEHTTIVDLIRNDLSIYLEKVQVNKFRYVDLVKTHEKSLIQVSSEISGKIPPEQASDVGRILYSLLPAGSISGAPKTKTLEIISQIENHNREFYSGVFGIFDGSSIDSGVMIRFIEQQGTRMVYKSGGGIHHLSNPEKEYQEMIDKVYVPVY